MRDTPLSACERNFIIKALGDRKVSRFRIIMGGLFFLFLINIRFIFVEKFTFIFILVSDKKVN